MRYRERGGCLSPSSVTSTDRDPDGTATSTTVYDTGRCQERSFESIYDVETPHVHKRIRSGEIILNPLIVYKDRERLSVESDWTFGVHPVWGSREVQGSVACELSQQVEGWDNSFLTYSKEDSLIGAYSEANSAQVQSLVSLIELKKTCRMLRRPFAQLRDLSKTIRRRRGGLIGKGLSIAEAARQSWLEYRYGWRPLMYEVEAITEAFDHSKLIPRTRLVFRSRRDLGTRTYESSSNVSAYGVPSIQLSHKSEYKAHVSSGVIVNVRNLSELDLLSAKAGIRLRDVPRSMWELVPYSFVVDWFVSVGDWLDAVLPNPYLDYLGNWTTTVQDERHRTKVDEAHIHVSTSPATDYYQYGGFYSERIERIERTVNDQLPTIPPRNPNRLSVPQYLDAVALSFGKASKNLRV